MPAIIRLKRRVDEQPLNSFVLNGKKRRLDKKEEDKRTNDNNESENDVSSTELNASDEISTLLTFAGTIAKQDNEITTKLAKRLKTNKDMAVSLIQSKSSHRSANNHMERSRLERRQNLQESRFRVVNCMRTQLTESDNTSSDDEDCAARGGGGGSYNQSVTIVDVEKQQAKDESMMETNVQFSKDTESTVDDDDEQQVDSDTGYVYDLYLPENEQQANNVDLMDDNHMRLHYPFNYYNNFCIYYDYDYDNNNNINNDNCHSDNDSYYASYYDLLD